MNNYLAALVDEFYLLGVRDVVVSPGSRSTALALLFEEYGKYRTFVNIDERSAAFFALGVAKGNARPVILICTSGSAGAHYYPAIVEAKFSQVPLIILTADRPLDLQFVSAPQTMDQTRLYGDFVNHFEVLAPPFSTADNYWTYPRKVAQKAYLGSFNPSAGPVQINVPLADTLPDLLADNYKKGRQVHTFKLYSGKLLASFDSQDLFGARNLILAGSDARSDYQSALLKLSEKLKAPILADPLSNLRSFAHENLIDSYDAFLADSSLQQALKPDCILLFGQFPVSKRLQHFIALHHDIEFIQVSPSLDYKNPMQTTSLLIQSDIKSFIEAVDFANKDINYLLAWQETQNVMRPILNQVSTEKEAFEGHYVQLLQNLMPAESQLLVANSMAIRDVDYFWSAQEQNVTLFGNRGLNGIDGTESTALGLSTNGKKTVLLTGDLSMLHDLNGLVVGKTEQLNLTIVLFNNDGGGIFNHLAQKNAPHFERLFSTPHGLDFSALAQLTGLDYQLIESYQDFETSFTTAVSADGIHLLEIKTDKSLSHQLHQKYTTYKKD
jgi:2-succinyl-5-enolpyruvyl-6-hydroxy-3-cyclohexene-1-carboxylate synthase